ncbi:MAG TPA: single-stranded DNA-binding protein [Mycobacteriales bacterium]|nr:single-stranded DNA-binding protein [Mycobacteriales bacterium]
MHEPTITLNGNVAAKPESRLVQTAHGTTAVATMRVAVTPRRRGRDSDDWTDGETMWFRVSAWRSTAANAVASLNQGDRVVVVGRLTQRTWTDGNGVERPSFNVEAESIGLDIARRAAMFVKSTPDQRSAPVEEQPAAAPPVEDDDVWVSTGAVDLETGEVRLERVEDAEATALA